MPQPHAAQATNHTAHLPFRLDKSEDDELVFVSSTGRAGARHRDGQSHVPRSSPPLLTASTRRSTYKRRREPPFSLSSPNSFPNRNPNALGPRLSPSIGEAPDPAVTTTVIAVLDMVIVQKESSHGDP
jgi:hypothetical protein